jgi:hypothetical protein
MAMVWGWHRLEIKISTLKNNKEKCETWSLREVREEGTGEGEARGMERIHVSLSVNAHHRSFSSSSALIQERGLKNQGCQRMKKVLQR